MEAGGLVRKDYCRGWFEREAALPFSYWHLRRAQVLERRRRRLDLEYLTECFKQLEGQTGEQVERVRWIVALLLLRKRIMEIVARKSRGGVELLVLRLRREDRVFEVADPSLSEADVRGLHGDLARIFNLEEDQDGSSRDKEGSLPKPAGQEEPQCLMEQRQEPSKKEPDG